MKQVSKAKRLSDFLSKFQPDFEPISRGLAIYAAAIALADEKGLSEAAQKAKALGAGLDAIYEALLQSYLFLGFPRMLSAAESFRQDFPNYVVESEALEPRDLPLWERRGIELCRRVYAENFDKLKGRIISLTPEIFDWMILEGYGKVLSRPALDIRTRELTIVSSLIIDNRPRQLQSHLRGALNVGVAPTLLGAVIDDLKTIDEEGWRSAVSLLKLVRENV